VVLNILYLRAHRPGVFIVAAKKNIMSKVGVWAYIAGLVIAIVVGFIKLDPKIVVGVLALLGIIVGLLNISDEEVQLFLVGSIAFVVAASAMGGIFNTFGFSALKTIADAIVVFTAPGALVVAFKALYAVAHDD
jgi:hypothetical protein